MSVLGDLRAYVGNRYKEDTVDYEYLKAQMQKLAKILNVDLRKAYNYEPKRASSEDESEVEVMYLNNLIDIVCFQKNELPTPASGESEEEVPEANTTVASQSTNTKSPFSVVCCNYRVVYFVIVI